MAMDAYTAQLASGCLKRNCSAQGKGMYKELNLASHVTWLHHLLLIHKQRTTHMYEAPDWLSNVCIYFSMQTKN